MAGIDGHPAVESDLAARRPVSDWFHGDDINHNGALFLAQNYSFFAYFGQQRPAPTGTNDYVKPFASGTQDGYKFYLGHGRAGKIRRLVLAEDGVSVEVLGPDAPSSELRSVLERAKHPAALEEYSRRRDDGRSVGTTMKISLAR
jgi:hypothetical protein